MHGRRFNYLLSFTLVALTARFCLAGGAYVSKTAEKIAVINQKAAISWDGQTETLILISKVMATELSDLGWIIPIKTQVKPKVKVAQTHVFYELSHYFEPLEQKSSNQKTGNNTEPDQIQILDLKNPDLFQVSVIKANDAAQVKKWFTENKFKLSNNAANILTQYNNNMFYFVMVNMQTPEDTEENVVKPEASFFCPICISFQTNEAFYPLKTSQINPGVIDITAFIVTKSPKKDSQDILKLFKWQPFEKGFMARISHCLPVNDMAYVSMLHFKGDSSALLQDTSFADISMQERVACYGTHFKKVDLTPEGWLYNAIETGDIISIQNAIKEKADVNREVRYLIPLHHAVTARSAFYGEDLDNTPEIVKTLVDAGADVNRKSHTGLTPLHLAVSRPHAQKICSILIEKGADVNMRNEKGWTPLDYAIRQGYRQDQLSLVEYLIRNNAKLGSENTPKDKIFADAAGRLLVDAAEAGKKDIVLFMLQSGVDINFKRTYPNQSTALTEAVKANNPEIAKILIEKGADLEATTMMHYNYKLKPYGQSVLSFRPIDLAAHYGYLEIAELLLKQGAKPNKGAGARSPIYAAAENGNIEMVKLLVKYGAKPDEKGYPALQAAVQAGDIPALELLLKSTEDSSLPNSNKPLLAALESGNIEAAILLLRKGITPASYNSSPALSYLDVETIKKGWRERSAAAMLPKAITIKGPLPKHVIWFYWYARKNPSNNSDSAQQKPTPFYMVFDDDMLVQFGGQNEIIEYLQSKIKAQ